jgi:hypothetical protein
MIGLKLRRCYVLCLAGCSVLTCNAFGGEQTDIGVSRRISGSVANIQRNITNSGVQFHVDFQEVRYDGDVVRTLIERDGQRLTVWLGLRDVTLTIGRTMISGGRRGAECGPLHVSVGSQREFWMAYDFELRQDGDGAEAHYEITGTRFKLPQGDWSVGAPEWVNSWGFGVTSARVTSGLQSSISRSGAVIEQRFLEAAPAILAQLSTHDRVQVALGRGQQVALRTPYFWP